MKRRHILASVMASTMLVAFNGEAAASADDLTTDAKQALASLIAENPTAKTVSENAVAALIFPNIVKAGLGIGGQFGEGALLRGEEATAFYNIAGGSWGLQIGAQAYSQAMFFMNEDALSYLDSSKGFEIGADANVALANEGLGYDITSSNIQDPIIAYVFGQTGLMAGITIEGSKITKITKE